MATLDLQWDHHHTYRMSSGKMGNLHLAARVIRRIRNRVFLAQIAPHGTEPTRFVALKMARGALEFAAIEREVYWYRNELRRLQGSVVPRLVGFFRGQADGTEIACMLMEYCTGVRPPDMRELNRQIMLTSCRLHEAGILHGDLTDGHHFVGMDNGLRIVDFSTAMHHRCLKGTPCLSRGETASGCGELLQLETAYGVYSGDMAPIRKGVGGGRYR